jgi:hypothetical protein
MINITMWIRDTGCYTRHDQEVTLKTCKASSGKRDS